MGYFDFNEVTQTVDIMGTMYSIYMDVPPEEDKLLECADGYCDWTIKRIVVAAKTKHEQHADFEERQKVNLRHEIIHAFLFESGIDQNTAWDIDGQVHPEQMVQWIARQYPKMLEVFKKVGAI